MTPVPTVRFALPPDAEEWLELRETLWPESSHDHAAEIAEYFAESPEDTACLVAQLGDGPIAGFAEVGLRNYAEGCLSSPVGYLEGIFVRAECRISGIGRALAEAAEGWARSEGCTEMASDRELANAPSGAFHEAIGYDEVERIVCFRKDL